MNSNKVLIILIAWLLAALIAGASGLFTTLVPPFPQAVLLGLVIVLLLAFAFSAGFRDWCLSVEVRALVLFHVVRFVGVYFLILYSQGRLPYDFAVRGGWGDIAAAAGVVILVLFVKPAGKTGWALYLLWNVLGFIDILYVFVTAARLAFSEPGSMDELLRLPLNLLLTFVVPIIIFTHIVIFTRLFRSAKRGYQLI
ncbi:MAG TPA: hypothetical protein VLG45_11950 [Thermodesulfobacteriota bacterium]|nr:hypothetical protein [Thermodesulfobacteriota bacterium]